MSADLQESARSLVRASEESLERARELAASFDALMADGAPGDVLGASPSSSAG